MRRGAAGILASMVMTAAFAVVAAGLQSSVSSQTAPTPTCPPGATLNVTTHQCETPATASPCPAGTTAAGATCTATVNCPNAPYLKGQFLSTAIFVDPRGTNTARCQGGAVDTHPFCPSGTLVTSFTQGQYGFITPPGIPGTITCTVARTFACPSAAVAPGTTCSAPATSVCPAGETLSGAACVASAPFPTSGFAFSFGGAPFPEPQDPPGAAPDSDPFCPGNQILVSDAAGDAACKSHDNRDAAPDLGDELDRLDGLF